MFVKTGIYSFIIGLLVGLLWVKDEYRTVQDAGAYITVMKPTKQYVLELLRFASTVSLASLIVAAVKSLAARRSESDSFHFYKGFMRSFIVVFLFMVVVLPLLMLISKSF